MNVEVIERLRAAAREHGEVADLLAVLAQSFPFLDEGSTEFIGVDEDLSYLKSAFLAAAFVEHDKANEEE